MQVVTEESRSHIVTVLEPSLFVRFINLVKNPRPFDEDDIALVKNYKFKLWRHVTEAKKKHSEKKMTKSDEPKPKRLRIAKDTKKSSSTLHMPKRPLTGFFIFVNIFCHSF
ncbi:unnamed protein product [Arabidopsis halleri]